MAPQAAPVPRDVSIAKTHEPATHAALATMVEVVFRDLKNSCSNDSCRELLDLSRVLFKHLAAQFDGEL